METKDLSKFSVRTSDRRTFRRCMRKWDFQSSMRQNLTHVGTEQNINFWFGSAIHFCMEDYHGYNKFQDPRRALYAYYHAFKEDELPLGAEMNYGLGISMLTYYLTWIVRHNQQTGFETVWMNRDTFQPMEKGEEGAAPAVEIPFYIPLNTYAIVDATTKNTIASFHYDGDTQLNTIPQGWAPENPVGQVYQFNTFDVKVIPIYYHGTIDRIVKDRYGRYWLWDYKTAKSADTAKLATDDQVSAYLWAARKLFPFPVYGFVYLQMTKERVKKPKRLKDGSLSVDKRQHTTYSLLRQELIAEYGAVNQAPNKLIQFLNTLAAQEEPEGDRFIRWDFIKRNSAQLDNTEKAIYGELATMLDPNVYRYPSPTRDCSWDCPFRDACILMDAGDTDGLEEFMINFEQRPHDEDGNVDPWRLNINWPQSEQDLIPMEDVLNYDTNDFPSFEESEENSEEGFKFYYEEEC